MTRMILNNQIALLQNGEAYFPAMEAALERAMHEIYLESYIFENDNTLEWVRLMKETIKIAAAGFSARRMVRQYIEKFYSTSIKNVLEE